ncbi:hypothetical protein AKJ66_02610, partial [candidate division MSBL1 archaeon SCGC-AAA259E22]
VLRKKNVHDLHEEPYLVDKYAFLGQEGSTGNIGFLLYSEDEVYAHLENQIKKVGDDKYFILVSHQPPYQVLDFARRFGTQHIGSESIRKVLEKNQIELNICGHVHMYGGRSEKLGDTHVVNIASGDEPEASARLARISISRDRPITDCFTIGGSEIRNLRGVGKVRSRKLEDSGLTSLEEIASKDPVEIAEKSEIYPKIAWKLWLSAKAIIGGEIFQLEDFAPPKDPLYLDVETTPEQRFMTGVYYPGENEFRQFTVGKWTAKERRKTEGALYRYLEDRGKTIVTYTDYDTRFLTSKMLKGKEHYDLYSGLRKSFVFPTQNYKLSSVGGAFGYSWEDPDLRGWDMPRLYHDYLETGRETLLEKIVEHNKDDVMAMHHIIEEIKNSEFERKNFNREQFTQPKAGRKWSKERIIERLNELGSELGRVPRKRDDRGLYYAATKYFDSWDEAKEAANLESLN